MAAPKFAWIPADWAWSLGRKPRLLRVAIAVARFYNHRDPHAICNPSIATLAECSGLDERHVQRALRELEALGIMRVARSRGGRSHVFRINLPKGDDPMQNPGQNGPRVEASTPAESATQTPAESATQTKSELNTEYATQADSVPEPLELIPATPTQKPKAKRNTYTVDEHTLATRMEQSYKRRFESRDALTADYHLAQCRAARKLLKSGRTVGQVEDAIKRAEMHPVYKIGDRFTSLGLLVHADVWARIMAEPTRQMQVIEGGAPARAVTPEVTSSGAYDVDAIRAARARRIG